MSFSEIMDKSPDATRILFEKGMHCCGCPMSANESLEQGAVAHGLDADEIVEELNNESRKNLDKK